MACNFLTLGSTNYAEPFSYYFSNLTFANSVTSEIERRGYLNYYVSFPYDTDEQDSETNIKSAQYIATVKTPRVIMALLQNCFADMEKAQQAFDAANVDGVVSLKTTESGTEGGTNAVTAHDSASGGSTNTSTFSPINSAYEKTSDKTKTDSSATNDRTQTTTDEKTTSKTTTREEWHGSGTPIETVSAAYMALSPIDKFLNALEMILLTPEEYYEIMGEM